MTWARVLQEVRQMRFEELYERQQRRTLTTAEAAEMLGIHRADLSPQALFMPNTRTTSSRELDTLHTFA